MSDIKLFRLSKNKATEIDSTASDFEKSLQNLIEGNLEPLLGIRFLASEHHTGKTHAGRIDTLGLDENNCPVIVEYKRSTGENVINQGLFYLDWLLDHKAEFKLLVQEQLGKTHASTIDWSTPRLICIAADFTKYDSHAVQQINRSIELIRYRQFSHDLLLLELVNAITPALQTSEKRSVACHKAIKTRGPDKTVTEWMDDMPDAIRTIFDSLVEYIESLGEDVQRKDLKLYIAFKRLRNFATVIFQQNKLILHLRLDPEKVDLIDGFTRDVREIGHWGTGDLEFLFGILPTWNGLNLFYLRRAMAVLKTGKFDRGQTGKRGASGRLQTPLQFNLTVQQAVQRCYNLLPKKILIFKWPLRNMVVGVSSMASKAD